MLEAKKQQKEVEAIPPYRGWLILLRFVRMYLDLFRTHVLEDTDELPASLKGQVVWDWKAQRELFAPTEGEEHSDASLCREGIFRLQTIKDSQQGYERLQSINSMVRVCEVANQRFIISLPAHEMFTNFARRDKGEDVDIGEIAEQMTMALHTPPQTLTFDGAVNGEQLIGYMSFRPETFQVDVERQTTYYPLAVDFTYQVDPLSQVQECLQNWCSTWTPEEKTIFWTNCSDALDREINRVLECIGREIVGDDNNIEADFVFDAEGLQSKYLARGFDGILVAGKHRLGSYPREVFVGAGETDGLLDRVGSLVEATV